MKVNEPGPFDSNVGKSEPQNRITKAMGHAFKVIREGLSNCMHRTDKTAQTEIQRGPAPKMGGPTLNTQLAKMKEFYDSRPISQNKADEITARRLESNIVDFDDDTETSGTIQSLESYDDSDSSSEIPSDDSSSNDNVAEGLEKLYDFDFDDDSTSHSNKK